MATADRRRERRVSMSSGMEGLALYGSRNSEDGLFRRYAAGRLREFWNRQVIGLSGAAVVGLTL